MIDKRNLLTRGWRALQFGISRPRMDLVNPPNSVDQQQPPAGDPFQVLGVGGSATAPDVMAAASSASGGQLSIGDGTPMESVILSYAELERIAKCVAKDISEGGINLSTLAIHHDQDLATLTAFRMFLFQVQLLQDQYRAITSSAPPQSIETSPKSITQWSSYIALFESIKNLLTVDVEVRAWEISIAETALVSQVVERIADRINIYYPQLMPVLAVADPQGGEILKALQGIQDAKAQADAMAVGDDILKQRVQSINALFDTLQADLLKRDPETGLTPLSVLLRAQTLRQVLSEAGGILYLKVARAGGSARTTKSLWTLFTGTKFEYTGAGVVTYFVFDRNGLIRLSRTLYSHSGFTGFKVTVKDNKGDNLPSTPLAPRNTPSRQSSPLDPVSHDPVADNENVEFPLVSPGGTP